MAIVEDQAKAEAMTSVPVAAGLELWFRDGGRRKRLPEWGGWMVRLGRRAARPAEPPRRLVTAIAVPARAYAAALCGAGCVLSRDPLRFNAEVPDLDELAAHFDDLCNLRPGSTVTVASGKAKHVGRFVRVDESRGEPHLVIEQSAQSKRAFTQYIPLRDAHNVAVRGLGLSCLLIGKLNELEPEICGDDVVAADGRGLQELLKARKFANRRDKDIRSDVIGTAAELPSELRDAQPAAVIFDGAGAFRRWKEAWRRSAWIVILDRTSRQFDEAVALVEQEFVERRYDDDDPLADLDVPAGIELMSFWSRQQ
jgi:hypothetical protein